MAEQRVSLSKKQLATAAGAELLKLCQTIKSDGRLSKDDIIDLANWLDANKQLRIASSRLPVFRCGTDRRGQESVR